MKKQLLIFVMLLTCSGFFVNNLFAQTVPTDGGGGQQFLPLLTSIATDAGSGHELPDNGIIHCNETDITFGILVANLEQFTADQEPRAVLPFPAQVDDSMAVEIILNGEAHYYDLTEFEYYGQTLAGEYVYSWEVTLSPGWCKGEGTTVPANWSMRIITSGDIDYPICKYTGPGEIFDCRVFIETQPYCPNTPNADCEAADLAHFSDNWTFVCQECATPHHEPGSELPNDLPKGPAGNVPLSRTTNTNINTSFVSSELGITPNPFTSNLQIRFGDNKSMPKSVSLFNLNGQIVKQWQSGSANDDLQINWDTSDIPSGMYFIQATFNNDEQRSYKVVKP